MTHSAHNPFALSLRDWKRVAIHTIKTMSEKDMSLRCAGVAFFGFLSIFPAIGIVVSLVGILGDYGALRAEIDRFSDIMPAIAYSLIANQLDSFMNQDQTGS